MRDQALAGRFDQHVRQAVSVAVGADAAGEREDIGLSVTSKHLFLRQRTKPRHAVGNSQRLRASFPEVFQQVATAAADMVERQFRSPGSMASAFSSTSKPFFSTARPTLRIVTRRGRIEAVRSRSCAGKRTEA